jgi:hypothetical protein
MSKAKGFNFGIMRLCGLPIERCLIGEWMPYLQEEGYAKVWCQVKTKDGVVHRPCWPNAGLFNGIPASQVAEIKYVDISEALK